MFSDTFKKILDHTGNPSQVFGAQRMRLCEGKGDGLDVIEIVNGNMLIWLMPGRCLDIGKVHYNGYNMSFLSKAGFSNAAYYDANGMNGLYTFSPGFLTTCGLRNSGLPNEHNGESFGFHGRIGQTPAENISIVRELDREDPTITVRGVTYEGKLFGSNLALEREIKFSYGSSSIYINDVITNYGSRDEPLMLLYHFNMGYPLLDENAVFVTTHEYERPVDDNAKALEDKKNIFFKASPNVPENCFYYRQQTSGGRSYGACINKELNIGVAVNTDPSELPLFCNWKSWASGDYVMGLEPCNCHGYGRKEHIERSEIEILPAYSSKKVGIRVDLLDTETVKKYL